MNSDSCSTVVEYDGRQLEVTYTRSEAAETGVWEYGDNYGSIPLMAMVTMIVKVPADYDGLVIGLDRSPAPTRLVRR